MKSFTENEFERDISLRIKHHMYYAIFFMGVAFGGICSSTLGLLIYLIRVST